MLRDNDPIFVDSDTGPLIVVPSWIIKKASPEALLVYSTMMMHYGYEGEWTDDDAVERLDDRLSHFDITAALLVLLAIGGLYRAAEGHYCCALSPQQTLGELLL